MPSSFVDQISDITNLIVFARPQSILDVGVGCGKYGFLAREYLDTMGQGENYHARKVRIEGIEVFPEYITPVHRAVYDQIHVGNATEILPRLTTRFDLLIMIDVLEHFAFEDGSAVLKSCRDRARNVLISTPKIVDPQGAAFGNPYETHKRQWRRRDLKAMDPGFFVSNPSSFIYFFGEDAAIVRRRFRKHRWASRIKLLFPAAVPWLRKMTGSRGN
jgi:2-polyprenyl-3-methyl-5-hydroxy-6-metoxy-1,4-benzoquinol methylase